MKIRRDILTRHSVVIGITIVGILLFTVISYLFGISPSFLLAFSTWLIMFAYAIFNLKERVYLAFFLMAFFVFLLGAHVVYEYFGMEVQYYLGDELYNNSNMLLFYSLISILVIFIVVNLIQKKRKNDDDKFLLQTESRKYSDTSLKAIQFVSKILFFISAIFWIALIAEKGIFVFNNSYLSYYVDFKSSMPTLFRIIGEMSPFFFYIFLATMPSKKELIIPLIIYVFYAMFSIVSGRRIELVVMVLFVLFYFVFRQKNSNGQEKWITKKMIVAVVVALPIIFILLYNFNYLRSDSQLSSTSLWHKLLSAVRQQGFSSSVIRLTEFHQAELNPNAYYSFFGLLKWLRTNTLIGLFYQPVYGFSYVGNSVEFATLGNSLSNSLSYIVLTPDKYLAGHALGSSYIAELTYDFGLIGVFLGSSIYGLYLSLMSKVLAKPHNRVLALTLCFSVFASFLKAPRWNFDIVFVALLDLGMWTAIAGTTLLTIIFIKIQPVWQKYKKRKS